MHPKMKWTYVGVDSHKDSHTAVFMDCFFGKLGEITFNNMPSEFDAFFKKAQKFKIGGTDFAFGLEDTTAYGRTLAVFLTGKKEMVKHVNAALVADERKCGSVLHKTDSFDAECAARVLLSRFDDLPTTDPQDKYCILQSLVARRNSLVKINVALKNHLHSLLMDNYPNYKSLFPNIATNTALVFFEKYPSPLALSGVTLDELMAEVKSVRYTIFTEAKANAILTHVARCGFTASEFQTQKDFTVVSIVRQVKSNLNELDEMDNILKDFLSKFDYNLTSMKGIDTVTASKLIAEIGDIRRFESSAKLARYAGVAPVTFSSGKSAAQFANERGNRELNEILFRLAVRLTIKPAKDIRISNHYFYEYYRKKLTEGKTKKQALKCIQRRLINIIYGMMKNGTEYINPPLQGIPKEESETSKRHSA